ncbi:S-adenosyl-L-methionine-dependent methyltransferase [Podospora aff. communis PSN243]|uniref:S-adenosyl-L-methionine-dependent methyltransferase n=1 Tax=Podospora aff. communis PSN243 TaxID=3040156 RepID=A0AAV9FX85_9PEZI|nr:S-adenosyl-L-methionine-dependent methyltransferase [Podospora aff. communis PSN243]
MSQPSDTKGKEPAASASQESSSPPRQSRDNPGETVAHGILPAEHWAQIADGDDDDSDSALEDPLTSTASITSSILNYRTINGRTFHSNQGNAQSWFANDKSAQESMDITHHAFTLILDGKLHLAPLEGVKLHKVLDVGTGTGAWEIALALLIPHFADDHPEAIVIGTDVSPIQPTWVPPNIRFEIEDCTGRWTFEPNSFDYIHMRFLLGSIGDWNLLMQRAFDACKPGGYIESFEPSSYLESEDGSVTDTMAMGQWGKLFIEGGRKMGRSFEVYQQGTVRAALEGAGFVDVHEQDFKVPIGGWPKDAHQKAIGEFTRIGFLQDPEGYLVFLAHTMGWKREQTLVFLSHLRRELRSSKVHAFYRQKVLWARKPEA